MDARSVLWATFNLWTALRRIRRKDRDLVVWIDAICINQACKDDKERQIQHLRWLYPRADRVICCLGEDDGTVSHAFALLTRWAAAYDDPALLAELVVDTESRLAGNHSQEWRALAILFNRPYWRRAWCLQEICVDPTKPPRLVCGNHELCWKVLYKGFLCMAQSLDNCTALTGNNVEYLLPMITTCWLPSKDMYLSDLIPMVAIREARKPHDIIFSLLGLAERRGVKYPVPDYDRSIEDTCVLYTREIINIDQRLCVLTTVDTLREHDNVPSWCIKPGRWAKSVSSDARRLDSRKAGAFRYSAARNMKPWLAGENRPLDPTLRLGGLELDRVVQVFDLRSFAAESLKQAESWSEMMKLCSTFCSTYLSAGPYLATNKQIITAFLRTITCDVFWIISQRKYQLHFQDRCYAAYQAHMRTLETEGDKIWMTKDQLTKYMKKNFSFAVRGLVDETAGQQMNDERGARIPYDFLERRVCVELQTVIYRKVVERRFIVTEKGYIGIGQAECVTGDTACLFPGSTVPLILREREGSKYLLVGDAYIHGVMYGEAVRPEGWRIFNIV